MDSNLFRAFVDFLAVTGGGQVPVKIKHYGQFIKELKSSGFVGGNLSQVITDEYGRIQVESIRVSSILGCGHLVNSHSEIKGVCSICHSFCCHNPGCLEVCSISGETVCNKHYKIEKGIIVSANKQGFFWKFRARKLRKKLDEFAITRKLIEDNHGD